MLHHHIRRDCCYLLYRNVYRFGESGEMSREIDRKIAELMGYNVIVSDTYDYWYYSEKYKGDVPIPPFSLSWEAMRLLVEWLRGRGITFQMFYYTNEVKILLSYSRINTLAEQWNKSAPLALCKAVLSLPKEVFEI
jgi:hypothetical protein